MKPRRVFVELEIISDETLDNLRSASWWRTKYDMNLSAGTVEVEQASVNVAKVKPARPARRKS